MMISTPVERVRMAISAQLSKLTGQTVPSLHESILIRNGLYCGRKFLAVDHEVVWFIEEDEIKFFGPSGTLISADSVVSFLNRYVSTEQIHEPSFQRRAA
jgi:hypothetical protein